MEEPMTEMNEDESPSIELYIGCSNGRYNLINNDVIDLDEILGSGNYVHKTTTGVS